MRPSSTGAESSAQQIGDTLSKAESSRFAGWRMVALALLAQSCIAGLTFGIYGTTIVSMETRFGVSRTTVSYCISVLVLTMGLLSPLVGEVLQRFSVRATLVAGALCSALGFGGLLLANNIYVVIAIYALVLGPAYCLLGPVPASTLVSHWFVAHRGRALGIVNMPLGLFIVPPVSAALVRAYGMNGAFSAAIALSLAIIPLMLWVVSRPADIGQRPLTDVAGSASRDKASSAEPGAAASTRSILRTPAFWLIMLGCCVFTGAGMTIATHIIPLAQERGLGLGRAAVALSAFGICGAAGAPFWGWMADRIGPSRAYFVSAASQALLWVALLVVGQSYVSILLIMALIGFCGSGATVSLTAASLASWLGPKNMSRAMGMGYFVKLPFLVGAPVLAGFLHDSAGNYQGAILVYVVSLPIVAIAFMLSPSFKRAI